MKNEETMKNCKELLYLPYSFFIMEKYRRPPMEAKLPKQFGSEIIKAVS
jgi:hypothetical protein